MHIYIQRLRSLNWTTVFVVFGSILTSFYLLSFLKFTTFDANNNTDSSWQYALSGLRHSPQQLGKDVYFTYGPLFEVMPTYVHAKDTFGNFFIGNVIFFLMVAICSWIFWRFYKICKATIPGTLLGITLIGIFATLSDIDTAFNVLLLVTFFYNSQRKKILGKNCPFPSYIPTRILQT